MALAPDTATPTERRIDDGAEARLGGVPARLPGSAWCVEDLPESWLPVLAWALSVELWNPAWSAGERRAAIRAAVAQHREKGTPAGVKRALDLVGAVYDYEEPSAFNFRIVIHNLSGLGLDGLAAVRSQLDRVKRASVHYTLAAPVAGLPRLNAAFAAGVGAHAVTPRALVLRVEA